MLGVANVSSWIFQGLALMGKVDLTGYFFAFASSFMCVMFSGGDIASSSEPSTRKPTTEVAQMDTVGKQRSGSGTLVRLPDALRMSYFFIA